MISLPELALRLFTLVLTAKLFNFAIGTEHLPTLTTDVGCLNNVQWR